MASYEASGDSHKDLGGELKKNDFDETRKRLYNLDVNELWTKDQMHEFEKTVYKYIQDQQQIHFMKSEEHVTDGIYWYVFYDAGDGPWNHFKWYVPVRNPFTVFDPATTSQRISKNIDGNAHTVDSWTNRIDDSIPEKAVHFPPQGVRITFFKGVFEKYHGVPERFKQLTVYTTNVDPSEAEQMTECNDQYVLEVHINIRPSETKAFNTAISLSLIHI